MDAIRVDYDGFPANNQTWRQLNTMIQDPTKALAKAIGGNVIITGLEDDDSGNGTFTGGFIVYDGELLPFKAGAPEEYFQVREVLTNRTYGDASNTNAPVFERRYAEFTSDDTKVAYSLLKRLKPLTEVSSLVEVGTIQIEYDRGTNPTVINFDGLVTGVNIADGPTPSDVIVSFAFAARSRPYAPQLQLRNFMIDGSSISIDQIMNVTPTGFDLLMQTQNGVVSTVRDWKLVLIE